MGVLVYMFVGNSYYGTAGVVSLAPPLLQATSYNSGGITFMCAHDRFVACVCPVLQSPKGQQLRLILRTEFKKNMAETDPVKITALKGK